MGLLSTISVGVEIDEGQVVVVSVEQKSSLRVVSMGRVLLPEGVVVRGRIEDPATLARAVKQAAASAQPEPIALDNVVTGLPESQVYMRLFELGEHATQERNLLVMEEAKTSIPIPENDMLLAYSVVSEEAGRVEIFLVGVHREVYQEWSDFWKNLGVEVTFDMESLALARGLFRKELSAGVAVVDVGRATTSVMIFSDLGLRYSYLIDVGEEPLVKALVESAVLGEIDLVEWLRDEGLVAGDEKAKGVLQKALLPLRDGVRASLDYYRTKWSEDIQQVILVGHSSSVKGLADYLKDELEVGVWLGEAWLVRNRQSVDFVEALGLAMWNTENAGISLMFDVEGEQFEKKGSSVHGEVRELQTLGGAVPRSKGNRKMWIELVILILLILFGAAGLWWFWQSRESARNAASESVRATRQSFSHWESFEVFVPLSVGGAGERGVPARLITTSVPAEEMSKGDDELYETMLLEIGDYERLWKRPVLIVESKDDDVGLVWLAYDDDSANSLLVESVVRELDGNVSYAVSNIEKLEVRRIDDTEWVLLGEVTLALEREIAVELSPAPDELVVDDTEDGVPILDQADEGVVFVTVLPTQIGYLNVRSGPDTTYKQVARVLPGEEYVLLEEDGDWVKIVIDDELEGWVFGTFVEKL